MQKEPNSTQNLEEKLTCHFESKDTIIFNITFLVFLIPAVIGVILAGYWLWLIGYIAYWFVFIQIWENKTLCSHCPHYNEEEKTIRCYGNKGIYKLWKYNPKPMSISHQIQFIVGIAILLLYPIPFLILGRQFILLFLSIIGIILWIGVQSIRMCTRCVNLSCPMNRVPKNLADKYIEHNRIMKEAWKEK